ncbi:MAG: ribonuclease P protein component, partial [Gemmatimonadota bacterium]
RGRRRRTGPVDVFLADSSAGRPRLGVVVPLYGHTAVERNRLQRQLREIGRREWLPGAWEEGRETDLLLRARPAAYGATFAELRGAVVEGVGDR